MLMSKLRLLLTALLFTAAFGAPARAQLATFQQGLIITTPITFDFGNGLSGTITFSGSGAPSSGLYNPTVSGLYLTSNFVLIAPGAIATFALNVPVSNLDLRLGTGSGGARTDTFVLNTVGGIQTQNIGASGASLKNQSFTPTNAITSFSISSSSSNPLRVSVQGTSTPVPAPLDPVGATLLGNLVAIGAVAAYRRRRRRLAPIMPVEVAA